jgi:hypothetical protein
VEEKRREAMRRMHTGLLGEPDANRPTGRILQYENET